MRCAHVQLGNENIELHIQSTVWLNEKHTHTDLNV